MGFDGPVYHSRLDIAHTIPWIFTYLLANNTGDNIVGCGHGNSRDDYESGHRRPRADREKGKRLWYFQHALWIIAVFRQCGHGISV